MDREGKAIAGVEIQPNALSHPTNGSVLLLAPICWGIRPSTLLAGAVTDQTGRFVLMLPQEANVDLKASHPHQHRRKWRSAGFRTLKPIILKPAGRIIGTVTDTTTGRPIAGVAVGAQCIEWHKEIVAGGWGDAMTDEQGAGSPSVAWSRGVHNWLIIEKLAGPPPSHGSSRGGMRRYGPAPDTWVDLTLIEGRPLHGVVIDQETDRPVAGTLVGCYGPARPQSGALSRTNLPTNRDVSRFTFLPASNTSTSWMAARPAVWPAGPWYYPTRVKSSRCD